MIRKYEPDLVFRTARGKMRAIVEEVKKRNRIGQPVLIGTTSIQNNEVVSIFLEKAGVKHEVLNAKNHEKEGAIIAQAGKFGAVTVATNMAGRGVDIILGGNPPSAEEAAKVREVGGLFVLGTERHEARRIDNQLRGRSGRQGDPGASQFFVSLEDDIMRIFGGDRIKGLMATLKIPEDQPIASGMISGAIESAQGKIEGFHFDTRKHVLDYDEVLNKQRQVIYERRRQVLGGSNEKVNEMIEDELLKMVNFHTAASHPAEWNIEEIFENIKAIISLPDDFHSEFLSITKKAGEPHELKDELLSAVLNIAKKAYQAKKEKLGSERMAELEKFIALRTLDVLWMDHLETMESLRDSVRLRAYGQKDPLVEYKREGLAMFERLLNAWQTQVVLTIFKVELRETPQTLEVQNVPSQRAIGRNDPCYCDSGKKFKRCHGK